MNRLIIVIIVTLLASTVMQVTADNSDISGLIIISWEGAQAYDVNELLKSGDLIALESIIKKGSYTNITIEDHKPDSLSGHAQMLSGYSAKETGVYSNFRNRIIPKGKTVIERIINATNIYSAIFTGNEKNVGFPSGLPLQNLKPAVDYFFYRNDNAYMIASAVREVLYQHGHEPFIMFVHFRDPEYEGQATSGNITNYHEALKLSDNATNMILSTINDIGIDSTTGIIVTTSNGFSPDRRRIVDEEKIWLASNIKLNQTGTQIDIVPTILELFRINPDGFEPSYQGRSLL